MMDCILVGNGTSLLEAENGMTIDAHKVVCRFNDVRIVGFEKHTGTKTDIWFTCLKYDPKRHGLLQPCRQIVAHSWQRQPDKCQTLQGYRHIEGVTKLDHALIDEMCAFVDKSDYRSWSTGALAIWMMLKEHEHVTITGFDWWERGPEQHHYADKATRGTLHRPAREFAFMLQLQADRRLSFLV